MDPELLRQTSGVDYLFAGVWAIALGLTLFLWPVTREARRALFVAWAAKIAVTLGLMLPYEAHYSLDAYAYFLIGQFEPPSFGELEFGDGSLLMKFLSGVHTSAIPVSYHAEKVTCAYIGLVAIFLLYSAARLAWRNLDIRAFYWLALFPSIIFWTSILGKDPIVLLGIAMFVHGIVGWSRSGRSSALLYAGLGVLLAAAFRIWLAAVLVAPLSLFLIGRIRSFWTRAVFTVLLALALIVSVRTFLGSIEAGGATDVIDYSNRVAHSWEGGGSGQTLDTEFTSATDFLLFWPLGVFTALLRPLPGEFLAPFPLLASLENGFLLALVIRAAVRFRARDLKKPLIGWAVAFVFTWAAVYSIASYQNLGSSVRFRLQILPVFLGLLLYLGRKKGVAWDPVDDADDLLIAAAAATAETEARATTPRRRSTRLAGLSQGRSLIRSSPR